MTDGAFKIEDGIPIPPTKQIGRREGGFALALRQMQPGQSIFVSGKQSTISAQAAEAKIKTNDGRQYTTRKVDGGVRIWRVS